METSILDERASHKSSYNRHVLKGKDME